MNKTNKKGFTLAELLIVVAIIAVLVAIAIPVFTSQLEKSREATDLANIRAAYAECTTSVLTNDGNTYYKKVTMNQKTDKWTINASNVAGVDLSGMTTTTGDVWVNVDGTGTFTVVNTKPTTGTELTD